jgi:hypothetical protein
VNNLRSLNDCIDKLMALLIVCTALAYVILVIMHVFTDQAAPISTRRRVTKERRNVSLSSTGNDPDRYDSDLPMSVS